MGGRGCALESLGLRVTRDTGANVVATLERVAGAYGGPRTIRLDDGSECDPRDLDC
jgi:hypothetical protein